MLKWCDNEWSGSILEVGQLGRDDWFLNFQMSLQLMLKCWNHIPCWRAGMWVVLGVSGAGCSTPPRQPRHFLKPNIIPLRAFPSTICKTPLGEAGHTMTDTLSLNWAMFEENKLVTLICFVLIIHYEHCVHPILCEKVKYPWNCFTYTFVYVQISRCI